MYYCLEVYLILDLCMERSYGSEVLRISWWATHVHAYELQYYNLILLNLNRDFTQIQIWNDFEISSNDREHLYVYLGFSKAKWGVLNVIYHFARESHLELRIKNYAQF